MECTFLEYTGMHLMYGLAVYDVVEAKRLYMERVAARRVPEWKTFESGSWLNKDV